jgi:hypothetical protein
LVPQIFEHLFGGRRALSCCEKFLRVDLHERLLLPVWFPNQLIAAYTAHPARKVDKSISSVETFLSSFSTKEPAFGSLQSISSQVYSVAFH